MSVTYNADLLVNAGLIEAEIMKFRSESKCILIGLTWLGHEFLSKIRNDTVWQWAHDEFKKQGFELPFDIVGQIAGGFMKFALRVKLETLPKMQ